MKLSNHPALFLEGFKKEDLNEYLLKLLPDAYERIKEFYSPENSGKMKVLSSLLKLNLIKIFINSIQLGTRRNAKGLEFPKSQSVTLFVFS